MMSSFNARVGWKYGSSGVDKALSGQSASSNGRLGTIIDNNQGQANMLGSHLRVSVPECAYPCIILI